MRRRGDTAWSACCSGGGEPLPTHLTIDLGALENVSWRLALDGAAQGSTTETPKALKHILGAHETA